AFTPSRPDDVSDGSRTLHGRAERVLMVAGGLLFAVSALFLLAVILIGARRASAAGVVLFVIAGGLFSAIALYSLQLCRRGLRGWSHVAAIDRASARFERLPLWGLFLGVTVWGVTGGHPPIGSAALLWYVPVALALVPLSAAIHELGHLLPGLAQG